MKFFKKFYFNMEPRLCEARKIGQRNKNDITPAVLSLRDFCRATKLTYATALLHAATNRVSKHGFCTTFCLLRPFLTNSVRKLWNFRHYRTQLVAWSSGRESVFGRCAFAVLRSTCSWWVTTYAGKPSAMGQPTRPTQPFILLGLINE